jgi:hypothetical protein
MKLSKEVKDLIDKWFDNKTPEEVDYILRKYTPNNKLPNDCVNGWGEVKFCEVRNGDGGKCKWCSNYI